MPAISLEHILTTLVILNIAAFTVIIFTGFNTQISTRYKNATIRNIVSDVSRAIASTYVDGVTSDFQPVANTSSVIAVTKLVLPEKILSVGYILKVNNSTKTVCGTIDTGTICNEVMGIPLGFTIIDNIIQNKTLNITYWRENSFMGESIGWRVIDHIVVD